MISRIVPNLRCCAVLTALCCGLFFLTGAALAERKPADKGNSLRAEVGKPLQAARDLMQQKQYKEALAKVDEASHIPSLTPYEHYIVDRMRGAVAGAAGDPATAIRSFEAALASGLMPKADELSTLEAISGQAYAMRNYPKVIEAIGRYRDAGGTSPAVLGLMPQVLYLAGRYGDAAKELSTQLSAGEKGGKSPGEDQLQLLASCALKQNDAAGYVAALMQLVSYYPKDSYWRDLIERVSSRSGFSPRLSLDVYRLRNQTNTLASAADYIDATELALQAGLPGEAQRFMDRGTAAGLLGKGAAGDVDRQNRLKAMIGRKMAEDKAILAAAEKQAAAQSGGDALINTGLNYVGYGSYDKGLALIQQGVARGSLANADEARLHLGYAQLLAGKKDDALKSFSAARGNDGTADLARLWSLRARSS